MQGNEVNTAFEILLEEIELLSNQLHKDSAQAFKAGSYDTARRFIEEATQLAEFREKVKALQKEWASLLAKRPRRPKKAGRVVKSRLARGLHTPEDAFRQPILEALVQLGGKSPVREVLNLVEKQMRAKLTKYDLEPLPSDPKSVRWRNTAQWCRNTLVREGLMERDSPHGIGKISDLGRRVVKYEGPVA